jgi:hypothetical protein
VGGDHRKQNPVFKHPLNPDPTLVQTLVHLLFFGGKTKKQSSAYDHLSNPYPKSVPLLPLSYSFTTCPLAGPLYTFTLSRSFVLARAHLQDLFLRLLSLAHSFWHVPACRFFIYILILLALHQMGVGLFRLVGVLARTMTIANTAGSFALLCIFLLGGFIIAKRECSPSWFFEVRTLWEVA